MLKERALVAVFVLGLIAAASWSIRQESGSAPIASDADAAARARAALELNASDTSAEGTGSRGLARDEAASETSSATSRTDAVPHAGESSPDKKVDAPPVAPPPAPAAPKRQGGSELYTGAKKSARLDSALAPGTTPDQKAAQLERSQDVAEKRGTVIGRIVRVNSTEVAGFAYSWDDLATPVVVSVYVDGALVASVPATAARPDLAQQDPSGVEASHGWSVPAPAPLKDADRHVVEASACKGDGDAPKTLESSPWALGGVQFPQGTLAFASPKLVYGWATDPSSPAAPVTIALVGDGAALAKVPTLGQGHNSDVFQQALALSPLQKLSLVVAGVSGPDDPGVPAAVQARANKAAAENHYSGLVPLASAASNPGVAYDELDFFAEDASGNATALGGQTLAGVKFSKPGDDVQLFAWQPSQALTQSYIQAQVTSADGSLAHELAGSPYQLNAVTNQLPYGAIAFASDVQISGWAVDPDALPGTISVDVYIDGTYVQRIPADKTFAALVNAIPIPDPNHAFTFTPPSNYLDGKTHQIQFFAVNQPDGVNPELKGSPAPFVGQRNAAPQGFLDGVSTDSAGGWAYDPDAGANPTQVEVWVDNTLWKTVPANGVRPDLVPIVAPEPTHGFTVALPDSVKDGKQHTVRVFADNFPDGPKQELANSPWELNAQQPWFGLHLADATGGISISAVDPGSPAASGGFVAGDLIRSFDGITDKLDVSAFVAWAKTKEVGESVVFRLYHDPTQAGAPTGSTTPAPRGTPPLGTGERIVVVAVGSH